MLPFMTFLGWLLYAIAVAAFISSIATVLWDALSDQKELRKTDPSAGLPWTPRRIIIGVSAVLGLVSLIATLLTQFL